MDTTSEAIGGLILAKWLALGAETGPLGNLLPPEDEQTNAFNTGKYNLFQFGRILWKIGAPQAYSVYGNIDGTYAALNLENGLLGFPTADEKGLSSPSRRRTQFEFGNVYFRSTVGSWPVATTSQHSNHLAELNAPRLTGGSIASTGSSVGCLKNITGAGFASGRTVTFTINNPDQPVGIQGSATVASNGTFTFSQGLPCRLESEVRKVNGFATVEARDSSGRRAFIPISTSFGIDFTGPI